MSRMLLVMGFLSMIGIVAYYALSNPGRACAHLYTLGSASEQEKTLAEANRKIAALQDEVRNLKMAHGFSVNQPLLVKMNMEGRNCEARVVRCQEEKAAILSADYQIGDKLSYTLNGADGTGTVKERPVCLVDDEKPGSEPFCLYQVINPPNCSSHARHTTTLKAQKAGTSAGTAYEIRRVSSTPGSPYTAGETISIQKGEKGTWVDASVVRPNGLSVKIGSSTEETCIFQKKAEETPATSAPTATTVSPPATPPAAPETPAPSG